MSVNLKRSRVHPDTRVEWVDDAGRLVELVDQWRLLDDSPFISPDWFFPWWEAFSDGRGLRTCLAWRGEELVGVAPMAERGDVLVSLVNHYSPWFDFAVRDQLAREALVDALIAAPHRCVAVDLVPDGSGSVPTFLDRRGARRAVTRRRGLAPIVDTSVGREAFRATTRQRWHSPLDRFTRKMIREENATFALLQRPQSLDEVLRRGFAVEASGWKGAAGTAILSNPTTESFYRNVAHAFAQRGELVLSWLSFGEQMVAFDLCLLTAGRLYLLKTGFDERHRRLAPGLVLRLAVIERCIELGLSAHELLREDSEWKRKFATRARGHVEIRLYRRGTRGTAAWAYRRFARPPLRSAYQRMRSVTMQRR